MKDFFELLKIKSNEIPNIDSLIQYLNFEKFNIKDRYSFLIKEEKLDVPKDHFSSNNLDFENSKESSYIVFRIDLSSNYYEIYHNYYEEENRPEDLMFEDFEDWINFLTGNNYVNERLEIETKNNKFIENINKIYSSKILENNQILDGHFLKLNTRKCRFDISIPKDNFDIFFHDHKNSKYINWNDFFLSQNYFTANDVFTYADEFLDFDKYIKINKNWTIDLLYKYCHKISNIEDIFKLEVDWNEKLIDYVIKNYTTKEGGFEFVVDENCKKETRVKTVFQENQMKCIPWDEYYLEKYYNFITESTSLGKHFIKSCYLNENDWSFELHKKYRKELDWWNLSKVGRFWNDEKYLVEFKYDINYDNLVLNKNFKINKKFLLENKKRETNNTLDLEWGYKYNYLSFENVIKSGFPIDIEIYDSYKSKRYDLSHDSSDESINLFLRSGNLTSDLIFFISKNLDNEFKKYRHFYRRSGGDLDIETNWSTETYWYLISLNPNIIWDDNLIINFKHKLFFENLKNIKLSYKTINELLSYNEYHFGSHWDTKYDTDDIYISNFNAVLLNCEIYDLTPTIFLQNEITWFGLWFNEKKFNTFIYEKIAM